MKDPTAYPENGFRYLHDFLYYVTLFYFSLNFFYHLINTHKKIFSYIKVVILLFVAVCLYKTFLYYVFPFVFHHKHDTPFPIYRDTIDHYIPFLIISFLFAYFTYVRESLKQKRVLEAQKLQWEAQISQANFNFLKAQINPHFLHNTLNFLYAKSLPYSQELSEGILTLSDIMRYALSKGNQKDGKAPLKDEIEHVHNVIKISQLRFSNQLNVKFEVSGTINGAQIVPFVLITLVENAFMHGDLKDPNYPIEIQLDVKDKQLYFRCRNKKRFGPKQQSTGIGLDNMKKRLDLAYGDQYTLTVQDEAEFYTTELTIFKL
ncbi:MAG TPA: histidine kinase [Chitinophagaceae bacterium]|nr:histidine kinase [Chitinophagaceae bacterium]